MRHPKLLLSPKATAPAFLLIDSVGTVQTTDAMLGYALTLKPDTIYRALVELQNAGALTFTTYDRSSRQITLDRSSWVWIAVRQLLECTGAVTA